MTRLALVACAAAISCGGGAKPATAPTPTKGAAAAASTAAPASITFVASGLRFATDSFEAHMSQNGQRMRIGSNSVELRKDGGGFQMVQKVSLVAMGMDGTMAVSVGAGLEPVQYISRLSVGGMVVANNVVAGNGKITGTMQTPVGPGQVRTMQVDAAITPGLIFDGDLFLVLLPTAVLSEGMKGEFPVLDDETGKVQTLRLTVEGRETVDMPAGKFETFRVRSSKNNAVFFVSTTAPRRVVMYRPADGLELRLMK